MPVPDCEEHHGHAEDPQEVPQHVAVSALSRMWHRVLAARSLREDELAADFSIKLMPATLTSEINGDIQESDVADLQNAR